MTGRDGLPPPPPHVRRGRRVWLVVLLAVIVPVVVLSTVAVATFVVAIQAFFIPSPSMTPTLEVNDRVLVNKLAKDDVHRGDIVVFERPPDDAGSVRELIKRVVALGGDTVESRGGQLLVNDQRVDEPYVTSAAGSAIRRQQVPPGHLFVLGDNRTNSADSRVFGPIREDSIIGRVFLRIWGSGGIKRL
jgi:signal peptidase I